MRKQTVHWYFALTSLNMDRSELIVKAAEICMREKGFHRTSVQSIASQAGISVGLIYKYYESKEAIIEALVTNVVQKMISFLNTDFERIAYAGANAQSVQDIVPPEIESSIVLLMEVSSEATRNIRIQQIMHDAWQVLKSNFIRQEQTLNPAQNADIIHTRLYVMSLVTDGLIIHSSMKQRDVPASFMPFLNTIINDINQDDAV